jgi:outer membrane protein assembly factor BamB
MRRFTACIVLCLVATGGPASAQVIDTLKGHKNTITCIAYSTDGRLLASGSKDGTVRLWDAVTGKPSHVLDGHRDMVVTVAFSPDGKLLAASSHDTAIKLWDTATGKLARTLNGHDKDVRGLAFAPDGKTFASGAMDRTVKLWDTTTWQCRITCHGHTAEINCITFTPDGRWVASGGWDKTVRLWNAATGEAQLVLEDHTEMVRDIVVTRDAKTLISSGKDGVIRIWDLDQKSLRAKLDGHKQNLVRALAVSGDGSLLASVSRDGTLNLWNLPAGKVRATLHEGILSFQVVAMSPDGKTLATGGIDRNVTLLDVAKLLSAEDTPKTRLSPTAVQDGDRPLAWPQFRGPGGSAVADGQKPPVEFGPEQNVKWKVRVPPGSSSPIVAGDLLVLTAFEGGKLYTIAYNRANGKEAWRAQAPAQKIEDFHKTEGSPAASTPATDGKRIVSYFGSCGLICYDLAGKELWKFELPVAELFGRFGSGVSPILVDGTAILLRDEIKDPRIYAVDAANGSLRWEKKRKSITSWGTPVVWDTPAGKQIAAPGFGLMVGYDLKSGDEAWSVAGMPSACCASPVTADGMLYFAGYSPGGADDKDFKMPSFDVLLKQAGAEKLGYLTRETFDKTMMKGFFDAQDSNKDGKLTREEWEANLKLMASGKNSAFALKAGGTGDVTNSHVVWQKKKGLPYVTSALVYRGQYVMVRDGGLVTAYDARTGKEIYVQERAVAQGRYYASPVAANGRIYFTSLDDGTVTVLKAGAANAEVVATNPPLGERVAATPAIADDTLYIRTAGHLYAFATKK